MKNKFSIALSLAVMMAMLFTSLALADNVQNDVTVGGNDRFTLGGSTTVNYRINSNNGDDQTGCNASDGSSASVSINVPTGVNASPNPISFTACDSNKPVVFTSTVSGDFEITVTVNDSGTGTYNTNPAKFTLHVLAPSTSTPTPTPTNTSTPTPTGTSTPPTDTPTPTPIPDTTPPIITIANDPIDTLAGTGWYNIVSSGTNGVKVNVSASDPSGVTNITCKDNGTITVLNVSAGNGSFILGNGTHSISCAATDGANNTGVRAGSTTMPVTYQIDQTVPTISENITPADSDTGWYNIGTGAPTISYDCADPSGSGIASGACPADVPLGEGANQSVPGKNVTDVAGNTSATTAGFTGINVDLTAPTISESITPSTPASTGWYNIATGAPTVSYLCADTGSSGLASGACTAAVTLVEGANQSVAGKTVTDIAGNTSLATAGFTGINVDLTAPALAPSVSPDPVFLNGSATAAPNATDTLSGVASSSCGAVNTSAVGTWSVNCTATDDAGNTATAPANYTVAYKVCVLYDQSKSHKKGSTVPVKLQLCDAFGVNVSSANIVVHATSVARMDPSASGILDDSGSANSPGNDFRYDATLGGTGGGYIFNLSTKPLSTGTWKVMFTVDGASSDTYYAMFDVK